MINIFLDPALLPLRDAFEAAQPRAVHVIVKHRGENVGTQMKRIVRKAGFTLWPRIFHNLRASCERNWSDRFPMPVVCAWTGHTATTAQKHYLKTVADEHYTAASSGAFLVQNGAEGFCNELQETPQNMGKSCNSA